jgi:hypothetical protein
VLCAKSRQALSDRAAPRVVGVEVQLAVAKAREGCIENAHGRRAACRIAPARVLAPQSGRPLS